MCSGCRWLVCPICRRASRDCSAERMVGCGNEPLPIHGRADPRNSSAIWMSSVIHLALRASGPIQGPGLQGVRMSRSVQVGTIIVCGAMAGAVQAQAAGDTDEELAQVVVTGSRIERADLEKTVPITVLDEVAMETRNAALPADLLTSLPSVVNLPQNESRLGSSGARGDNANINMRNLGATATLILQDGRRMAINPMTAGLSQAVNVNQLPTHGVERIEVLRDGASSIYGSDAVGGVINYVLKRQMEGMQASVRYDQPEDGGGEIMQAGLGWGGTFAAGRGRLFGTVNALSRKEVRLTDRDFSDSSLNVDRAP